jgi:hypothetical protein
MDLGSGGVLLLHPPGFPPLAAAGGKDGRVFFLQRSSSGSLSLLQTLSNLGGCWCGFSYFIGEDGLPRLVISTGSALTTWHINNPSLPNLSTGGTSGANINFTAQDPGFFTSVSCSGSPCASGTGVIWAVSRPVSGSNTFVDLYAFASLANSQGVFTPLFSTACSSCAHAGNWPNTGGNANIVPVVANGKVYVASNKQLAIFGLFAGTAAPTRASAAKPAGQGGNQGPPPQPVAKLPYKHVKSGMIGSFDGTILTLHGRGNSHHKIDLSQALANLQVGTPLTVGVAVTAVSNKHPEPGGILPAEAVTRAKGKGDKSQNPDEDLWPPDQDQD